MYNDPDTPTISAHLVRSTLKLDPDVNPEFDTYQKSWGLEFRTINIAPLFKNLCVIHIHPGYMGDLANQLERVALQPVFR